MARDPAGSPGSLKVKTAGNAIDIEEFAGEIQARADFALHCFEVHFRKANAAAGDEFIFVQAFAGDGKFRGCEVFDERLVSGATERRPTDVGCDGGNVEKFGPQAGREGSDGSIRDELGGISAGEGAELGAGFVIRFAEPVNADREFIGAGFESARAPGGEAQDAGAA